MTTSSETAPEMASLSVSSLAQLLQHTRAEYQGAADRVLLQDPSSLMRPGTDYTCCTIPCSYPRCQSPEVDREAYGKSFRALRTESKLSRCKLAAAADWKESMVTRIERGWLIPGPRIRTRLAVALGQPLEEIHPDRFLIFPAHCFCSMPEKNGGAK